MKYTRLLPALSCAALMVLSTGPAAAGADGKRVYNKTCGYCHEYGVSGAPRRGDEHDWQARAAQGKQVLYTHAINGFKGMPARGANPALSNADVRNAVDYMLKETLR